MENVYEKVALLAQKMENDNKVIGLAKQHLTNEEAFLFWLGYQLFNFLFYKRNKTTNVKIK